MEDIVDFVGVFSGVSESQTSYGEVTNIYHFDGFITSEEGSSVRSIELPLQQGKSYDQGRKYYFKLSIEARKYRPKNTQVQPVLFSLYESLWEYFFIVKVVVEGAASGVHSQIYINKKLQLIREINKQVTTSSKRLSYSMLKSVFKQVNNDLKVAALPVAQADCIAAKSNANLFFDIGLSSPYNKASVDSGVTTPQQMEFCRHNSCTSYLCMGCFCKETLNRENFTFITHFDTDHYSYLHGKGKTKIEDFRKKINSIRLNKFNKLNFIERLNVMINYYIKNKILSGYFVFPLNIEAFKNECIQTISHKYLTVANLQFILEVMTSSKGFYIIPHSNQKNGSISLSFNNGGKLLGSANWVVNDANNSGVSYSLNLPNRSYLFTGDKGFHHLPNTQSKAHYDAIMACHHGAEVQNAFIPRAASQNALACFSFGFNKQFSHPRESAIEQASEYAIKGTSEHLYWYREGVKPTTVKAYQKISIRVKLSE